MWIASFKKNFFFLKQRSGSGGLNFKSKPNGIFLYSRLQELHTFLVKKHLSFVRLTVVYIEMYLSVESC